MHYYQFNIGDYRRDTAHLSRLEHSIYRDLIDWYYLDEAPIPSETQVVSRRLRLVTQEEATALESVLNDFFTNDNGWHHSRIDADIADYHAMAKRNKTNGKLGGRPKKTQSEPSGLQVGTQTEPTVKPTKNQEPTTPKSPKGDSAIKLKTFLENCRLASEKPISGYKPVFEYAEKVGIPQDFIQLAWYEFCRQFGDGGVKESRKQKDWRSTFRNYVEKGYLKLWWISDGKYELTTNGKQAQLANSEKLAA